jgi:hypothetical protein
VVYIVIVLHVAAMLWFGVIANDLAMARCRRLRERAEMLDDFAPLEAWMRRGPLLVSVRSAVALVLLAALPLLVWTGVYP